MSRIVAVLGMFVVALMINGSAQAVVTLNVNGDGQLIGANNVNIDGTLFDVSFADGTCGTLYSGCDSFEDFTFTSFLSATVAATALLDQVFLDVSEGSFDSTPELTLGCEFGFDNLGNQTCNVLIPYRPSFSFAYASNTTGIDLLTPQGDSGSRAGINTETFSQPTSTFAKFSLSSERTSDDVPEPGTLALFGFSIIGLVAIRRRRNQTVH